MDMRQDIPAHLFWDTDPEQVDPERHRAYIIERVLEHGNEKDAEWMLRQYARQAIIEVLEKSRRISAKSKNYWGIILGLWKQLPQSAKRPAQIWKY